MGRPHSTVRGPMYQFRAGSKVGMEPNQDLRTSCRISRKERVAGMSCKYSVRTSQRKSGHSQSAHAGRRCNHKFAPQHAGNSLHFFVPRAAWPFGQVDPSSSFRWLMHPERLIGSEVMSFRCAATTLQHYLLLPSYAQFESFYCDIAAERNLRPPRMTQNLGFCVTSLNASLLRSSARIREAS